MNSAQEEMDLLDGCVSMRLHQMGLEELPLGSRFNPDLNPILLATSILVCESMPEYARECQIMPEYARICLAALAIENVIPL